MSSASASLSWHEADCIVKDLVLYQLRGENIFVGGSYIRKNDRCNDIDVLILPDKHTKQSLASLQIAWNGKTIKSGPTIKQYRLEHPYDPVTFTPFQLDVWICHHIDNWGVMSMYVAGDGQLNVKQRAQASRQGYKLGYSLTKKSDKSIIAARTEKDVYDHLGWAWIPYDRRTSQPK